MSEVGIFQGNCGQNSSATSQDGLAVDQKVQLNGKTDLSSCIEGNDDAKVYEITLSGSPGYYNYVLNVNAQGPRGFGSGSLYLAFTDQSGDTYKLSIYSSRREMHTLRYDSNQPRIMKIQWSNESI